MNTYMAVIKDYTDNRQGEIIAIIEQPREHLGKDFLRYVAWYMWRKLYKTQSDRDMCATITKNGSFVASMGCAYLHHYKRMHTTICGKFPSKPYTFRAFNTRK